MYRQFFGLNDLPFRSTPDLKYFYSDASRGEIVDAISYSLERGDGIVKVIGEVGSGKTTILRKLALILPAKFHIIYLNSPNLPPFDILLFICHEFGLEIPSGGHKFLLINLLKTFFIEQHAKGRRCVIMVDEAQSMPVDTLEEVRLLLNLETDQDKLVQVLMFGQPELDITLERKEIKQFKTRISHSIYLPPLDSSDIHSYLNFRMRKAGYQGKDVFDFASAKLIARRSKGVLRIIHNIADAALLSAYSEERRCVIKTDVEPVGVKSASYGLKIRWLMIALLMVSVIMFSAFYSSSPFSIYALFSFSDERSDNEGVAADEGLNLNAEILPASVESQSVDDISANLDHKPVEGMHVSSDDSGEQVSLDESLIRQDKVFNQALLERLKNQSDYVFSVQIIVGGLSDLDRVVNELGQYVNPDELFWIINRPRYTLYYGFFSDFNQAQQAISLLPSQYIIGKPLVVRAVRVIRRVETTLISVTSGVEH